MENQSTFLDKAVKMSIILGVLIIALSVAYYLILKPVPVQKTNFESCYVQCQKDMPNAKVGGCNILCSQQK